MTICKYCNTDITYLPPNKRGTHVAWCHTNPTIQHRLDNLAVQRQRYVQRGVWNVGLTKNTDSRVASSARKTAQSLIGLNKGMKHTAVSKLNMSKGCLASKHQRVCKKSVLYNGVKLDSSYELRLARLLDKHNIRWVRPSPLKWVDSAGKVRHYFPDFYLPDKNIYLDPKNSYCFKVQHEKIKYIQSKYSNVIFMTEQQITEQYVMTL